MTTPTVDWQTCRHTFAPDHPTGPGHFPGNPIIPGALLLAHALRAAGAAGHPTALRNIKFFAPVRPGDTVEFRWRAAAERTVQFEARLQDQLVMSGVLGKAKE